MKQKTILVTAYAVNPYKGSEDGMGWNFICQIARHNRVIAITRENNRPHIERFILEKPMDPYFNIKFVYFDLPARLRFWKKGSRGAMLYYQLWQRAVVAFIQKSELQFDIVHNLNFHNNWTPSFLRKLNKPMVWGPIGHHPLIPAQYLQPYKKSYWIKDRLTWIVKQYFWKISPALRQTIRHADRILCMNPAAPKVLNLDPKQYEIMPSVATEDPGEWLSGRNEKFTVISAGRLVPLKGFDLTIRAFAQFWHTLSPKDQEKTELVIVGSGPELAFYQQMAATEKVESAVRFIEWIDRRDLMTLFKNASAFLFPSHEGAGMVVAEALSFGLPVVCLDNSGPGAFIDATCGIAVPEGPYSDTVKGLSEGLQRLYFDAEDYLALRQGARARFESHFHWDRRGEQLRAVYEQL